MLHKQIINFHQRTRHKVDLYHKITDIIKSPIILRQAITMSFNAWIYPKILNSSSTNNNDIQFPNLTKIFKQKFKYVMLNHTYCVHKKFCSICIIALLSKTVRKQSIHNYISSLSKGKLTCKSNCMQKIINLHIK